MNGPRSHPLRWAKNHQAGRAESSVPSPWPALSIASYALGQKRKALESCGFHEVMEMDRVLRWPCPSVQFSGTKVIYHVVQPL